MAKSIRQRMIERKRQKKKRSIYIEKWKRKRNRDREGDIEGENGREIEIKEGRKRDRDREGNIEEEDGRERERTKRVEQFDASRREMRDERERNFRLENLKGIVCNNSKWNQWEQMFPDIVLLIFLNHFKEPP